MDTKSRSTTWHDIQTNTRGKALEEFLNYHQLHIINEDSARTNFQSSRGSSKIDLIDTNNHMVADIEDWKIMEKESCSDQNKTKYSLNFNQDKNTRIQFPSDEIYKKRATTRRISQKITTTANKEVKLWVSKNVKGC